MARRCCLAICAAYFYDELALEFVADADCFQRGLRLTFTLMGAPPQPKKGFVPMADRRYLGASVHSGHRELYVSNPRGSLRPRLYPASITPMRLANSGEI